MFINLVRDKKLYLIICLILLAGCYLFLITIKNKTDSITLQNKSYQVAVADTPNERELGLSGREPLNDHTGMLFVYDQPGQNCFWMKDMKFNIDILWFNTERKLIHKQVDLSPESYPTTFCPPIAAQYVVELKANEARSMQIGDQLSF